MVPVLGSVDPVIRMLSPPTSTASTLHRLAAVKRTSSPKARKFFRMAFLKQMFRQCTNCHGMDAKGSDAAPRLAGQIYPYTVKVLTNWAIINREQEGVKAPTQHLLTDAQIAAVASYLSNKN